jgi:outer membrane protein OmpA-like peptidoglycan-associated protein
MLGRVRAIPLERLCCFLLALVFSTLVGCAKPRAQVVLIADPEGRVGALEVKNAKGSQILDKARQSVRIQAGDRAPGKPQILSESEIQATFGAALSAQPKAPSRFILNFEGGSVALTEASRPQLLQIVALIRERNSVDISVVGHADTLGSEEVNNLLARQRAEAVAKLLVEAGVDPTNLEITSHGKTMLLVPTGDSVAEPRNRRVEVTVR